MTAERHAGAPPRWHDRFSSTRWAAWTFALTRPEVDGDADFGEEPRASLVRGRA